MTVPRNFIEELDCELAANFSELARQAERLALLTELHRVAVAVALRLGRPVTIFDVFDSAATDDHRRRLEHLARLLRRPDATDRIASDGAPVVASRVRPPCQSC